ncbi:accessory Sec system protein Asp2 [Lacticaseibacillus paracasei]|uniref:accessory Sec system protein Asp2 n=1 Tax=Lacticaseibacillus paracasei TaxID=1597 RepID=UPI001157F330|nr:accessory Sec system protein Asp2 [Lacticaseibacillus paracasei]VTZ84864.1 Accessory Sec system protein Asp2 [Lacticaseibacillus paracasei]
MAKKNKKLIIHFGAVALDFEGLLLNDFEYVWQSDPSVPPVKDKPLLEMGRLNRYYQDALFLLDETSPWIDDETVLTALPANQILCDNAVRMSARCEDILDLKGTFRFDFKDLRSMAEQINYSFFGGQDGYRIKSDAFTIAPNFTGNLRQMGHVYHQFEVDFDAKWRLTAYPNISQWVPGHIQDLVLVDFDRLDDSVHIKAVLNQYDTETNEILKTDELVDDDLKHGFLAQGGKHGIDLQLLIFTSGKGRLRIGQFHLRRSRAKFDEFFLNGRRLIDPSGMNTELATYFDAGDLKPPLTVYFSGYRPAEGFEGNYMMRSMGAPFLLFTDTRLEGGAFYLGSHAIQEEVLTVIKETLKRLHFKSNELILSGLSMGSFGALYYGARLAPDAIVVAKPLVNIGSIAAGTHLTRPSGFATSLDMLMLFEGDLERTEELNQTFWKVFKSGNFSKTTFAIAYMMNDDYDINAFPDIRQYLKTSEPTARILSKGIPGRHNDDTNTITRWFLMQYRHLLEQQYGRHFN